MSVRTQEPISLVQTFFDRWTTGHINDAVAMLAHDVVYDVVPLPPIQGRLQVEEFHRGFGVGCQYRVDCKLTLIAAASDVVLTERLDTFRHSSGKTAILPVMGTLTVVDGFITVWRDYFDHASFEKQLAAIER